MDQRRRIGKLKWLRSLVSSTAGLGPPEPPGLLGLDFVCVRISGVRLTPPPPLAVNSSAAV